MRWIYCFVFLLPLVHSQPYDVNDLSICGRGPPGTYLKTELLEPIKTSSDLTFEQAKIIGGTVVQNCSYPWHAALFTRNLTTGGWDFLCGGSLLNQRFILTAAHCHVTPLIKLQVLDSLFYQIGLGNNNYEKTKRFSIDEFVPHPDYNSDNQQHDLALIKLSQPVTFSKRIRPVCLAMPEMNRDFGSETTATMIGWGQTSCPSVDAEGRCTGMGSKFLLEVNGQVVNLAECRQIYQEVVRITNTMICAGERRIATCHGDSGGSLTIPWQMSSRLLFFLHGITSFGVACSETGFPSVFTRIEGQHYNWILQTMNSI